MVTRVLHLSHNGLPDARIERLAKLSKDFANSIFLGGPSSQHRLFHGIFENIISTEKFGTLANLGIQPFYGNLVSDIRKIVQNLDVDLIYAHNIIAARVAVDLAIPFVYDDHEYWSKQALIRRAKSDSILAEAKNKIRYFWAPRIYSKWEKKILKTSEAIVTVSDVIAKEHRNERKKCLVVPNFPLIEEVSDLPRPQIHSGPLRAITLASNFEGFLEHRHPGNNLHVWEEVSSIEMDWVGMPPSNEWTWIKHRDWIPPANLLQVLTRQYQIGAIPWRSFWYHRYCMPNKAASYSHAGLILFMNTDYESITELFPKWSYRTFDDAGDIRAVMREISSKSPNEILAIRRQIQSWASENVILNRYSDQLRSAIVGSS